MADSNVQIACYSNEALEQFRQYYVGTLLVTSADCVFLILHTLVKSNNKNI